MPISIVAAEKASLIENPKIVDMVIQQIQFTFYISLILTHDEAKMKAKLLHGQGRYEFSVRRQLLIKAQESTCFKVHFEYFSQKALENFMEVITIDSKVLSVFIQQDSFTDYSRLYEGNGQCLDLYGSNPFKASPEVFCQKD